MIWQIVEGSPSQCAQAHKNPSRRAKAHEDPVTGPVIEHKEKPGFLFGAAIGALVMLAAVAILLFAREADKRANVERARQATFEACAQAGSGTLHRDTSGLPWCTPGPSSLSPTAAGGPGNRMAPEVPLNKKESN